LDDLKGQNFASSKVKLSTQTSFGVEQHLAEQVDIYSKNILPEWPIQKLDEVRATCGKYFYGHSSRNDRAKMLLWAALADTQRLYDDEIIYLHLSRQYDPTLQLSTLMALFFKFRGLHDQADVHINTTFRLVMSYL
jgi:hypothetical protein